jgi:uncharacterized membrane protein required for colicin V production
VVDVVIVVLVLVAAVFGLIRGIISQIMGMAGLVAAYLFAPAGGKYAAVFVQHQLGCSKFMAGKVSILLIGVLIYIAFRLVGLLVEKLFVNRVKEFKSLNRLGGAALGAVKATVILAMMFCFLALVPREEVRAWFPKVLESRSYLLAAKYNPMGKQVVLERMRHFRTSIADPQEMERLKKSDKIGKILEQYELRGALNDKRFVEPLQQGDFDTLQKNEQIEKLMKDDQLTTLLDDLEKKPPR